MEKSYSELLQHPKWQKKRLEIMNRDNFKCRLCNDANTSLNVHHKKYSLDKKPWEYDNEDLITLCKHCHEVIESTKKHWEKESFDFELIKVLAFFNEKEDTKISLFRYDDHAILLVFYEKGCSIGVSTIFKDEMTLLVDFLK